MNDKVLLSVLLGIAVIVSGAILIRPDALSGPIGWVPSSTRNDQPFQKNNNSEYNSVIQQSKDSGKKIVLFFTGPNCVHCEKMKTTVFPNASVQASMSKYIFYAVDTSKDKTTTDKYKVKALPTLVIVDSNEVVQKEKVGFMSANELVSWLGQGEKNDKIQRQQQQQPRGGNC